MPCYFGEEELEMKRLASALLALLLTLTLVLPNLASPAWADTKPSEDYIAQRPIAYQLFFDSENEAYTFNTATYWDVYQQTLGVNKNGGENEVNKGLTLTSSTDGALVRTGSGSDTGSVGSWSGSISGEGWGQFPGDFTRTLRFTGMQLKAGANEIQIRFQSGSADLRGLRILSDSGEIARLVPGSGNVQSVPNDYGGSNQTADKSKDWIEANGGTTYKEENGCFGWVDQGSVTYHFVSTSIPAGTYTVEVEYALEGQTSCAVQAIANGNAAGSDLLRIDYESAQTFYYSQYQNTTVFPYSDGSATVVGWGGTVKACVSGSRDRLAISLRTVSGPALEQLEAYLKLYAVDSGGNVKYSGTLADLRKNGAVSTTFEAGFTTYISPRVPDVGGQGMDGLPGSEGIKLIFETPNGADDISGTVEIAFVGLFTGGSSENADAGKLETRGNWTAVSPFQYQDAVIHPYEEKNLALNQSVKPFLRLPGGTTNQSFQDRQYTWGNVTYTKGGEGSDNDHGTISGSNISGTKDWHLWTMSTSDANIVDNTHADKNGTGSFNALEIKYRNDGAHRTFAALTGTQERRGQWLALTMKGEDLEATRGLSEEDIGKIRIVLKRGGNVIESIPLSEFKSAPNSSAPEINLELLADGYRTLYFSLNDGSDLAMDSVEFDFSEVQSAKAGSDTHRIYVKDIYLFNPKLSIVKAVDRAEAKPGDTLRYTLTVLNPTAASVTNPFTVSDVLPAGLRYVDGSYEISDGRTAADFRQDGQSLTWSFTGALEAKASFTITFQVEIESAVDGQRFMNTATVTVDGETEKSNEVKTVIRDNTQYSKVFYAQVGKDTTLNLDLGQTMVESTRTETVIKEAQSYTVRVAGNNGAPSSGSCTVDIPAETEYIYLTGPGGGFVFAENNSVTLGSKSWKLDYTLTEVQLLAGRLNYHESKTTSPVGKYDDPANRGPVSGFLEDAKLSLLNFNRGDGQRLTLAIGQAYNDGEFTLHVMTKQTVEVSDGQVMQDNTFSGIQNGDNTFTVTAPDGAEGRRTLALTYNSTETGTKTFEVRMNKGGNPENTETVTITVYNYEVKDYVYVLDYGLPVYLTGKDGDQGVQSLQGYSGTNLIRGEAEDGLYFYGLSGKKYNETTAADGHYANEGYAIPEETFSAKNGTVKTALSEDGGENLFLEYTPTRFMDCEDVFYYGVQVKKDGTLPADSLSAVNATPVMEGQIKVLPASVVYYEDNFSNSGSGANGDDGIRYGGETQPVGEGDTDRHQSNDLGLQYGYDPAYDSDEGYSGGTATMMRGGSYAVFQFKGTGVDIISSTAANTGTVYVYVFDNAAIDASGNIVSDGTQDRPTLVDMQIVNTYFENNGETGLYQIPVVNVKNLDGTKKHVVRIAVSTYGGAEAKPIYLDGIRIYNPLGGNEIVDYTPSEQGTVVRELRDMILGTGYRVTYTDDGTGEEYAVVDPGKDVSASLVRYLGDGNVFLSGSTVTENFTGAYYGGEASDDTAMTANLLSYLLQGPNNEVYLSDGYGIAFYAEGTAEGATLQIAAKRLLGAPKLQYLNKNNTWVALGTKDSEGTLGTSTELYYVIPLDDCMDSGSGKLIALRAVGASAQNGTPKDVVSLTYVKASKSLSFRTVSDQLGNLETQDQPVSTMTDVQVRYPGANQREVLTFATGKDVLDVKVLLNGSEVPGTVTASYVFDQAGNKTWVVTIDQADPHAAYTLRFYKVTGESTANLR